MRALSGRVLKASGFGHVPSAELPDIAVCVENVGVVAAMVVFAILGVLDRPAVRHKVGSTKQSLSGTSMMSNSKL